MFKTFESAASRLLPMACFIASLLSAPPPSAAEPYLLSGERVLPGGNPANEFVRDLLERLESPEGEGVPVSRGEFAAWCDSAGPGIDERALQRYARPGSVRQQDFDHARYARSLMSDDRIAAGAVFLREHKDLLRAAQSRYGVARQDIVAVLMWESALGEIVGETPVFSSLVAQLLYLEDARAAAVESLTAAGAYDPEQDASALEVTRRFEKLKRRAVSNLTALLRLSKAKAQDPTALRGSWAGAIGYPQFMPSSLEYAVDGDGDGIIDLQHWPDVIFSVARYLHDHGYDMSYAGRKRGLYRYNPIDSYVHGVIRYADAIMRR